jgi:hypothetical protein
MTIRSELESRLNAFASAQIPPIPIAVEGGSFNKPASGAYLEIFLLRKAAVNRNLAAIDQTITGKAQINVYMTIQAGSGMGQIEALVEKVKNLYPVIPKIGIVSIEKPCDEADSYIVGNFTCVPITVSYRVET